MTSANPYTSEKSYASSNLPFGAAGIGEVVKIEQFAPRYRRFTLAGERFREIGELNAHTCTARLFLPIEADWQCPMGAGQNALTVS